MGYIISDEKGVALVTEKTFFTSDFEENARNDLTESLKYDVPTWIIGCLAMLNAKGIEQRVTPAPKNLNKRRVAAGKPPIGEIREIFVRVGGVSYRASGEAEVGSHRSPRLHWRRGHIRRLASGEMTHVRPCLVGERIADEEPAKKTYRVLA